MNDLDKILVERGKTHGDYSHHSACSQQIKTVIRSWGYENLSIHERETLEMIAHKMARILTGDPHFEDHWRDIAGYATLSADRNKKDQ
jgi:hypothetical protein